MFFLLSNAYDSFKVPEHVVFLDPVLKCLNSRCLGLILDVQFTSLRASCLHDSPELPMTTTNRLAYTLGYLLVLLAFPSDAYIAR